MKFGTNSGIFLPFSAFFGHFLWESRDISSFSENIREILIKFHQNFAEKWPNSLTKVGMKWNFISFHFIPAKKFDGFLLEFWGVSGAKAKKSCRARKMLKNEPTLAIVAVDTGENEPLKVWGVSFHYFNRILRRDLRVPARRAPPVAPRCSPNRGHSRSGELRPSNTLPRNKKAHKKNI